MRSCIWVLAVAVASCVPIKATTTYSDTLVSRRTAVDTIPGSLRYAAASRLAAQTLQVTLTSSESCRSTVTPTYHRTAHVVHEVQGAWTPGYTAALGVLSVATGAFLYLDADDLAARAAQDGNDANPSDYRATGAGAALVGVVALAIAGVDAARLRDFDDDLGRRRGMPEIRDDVCHHHPVANTSLIARAAQGGWSAESATNASGVAQLSLRELPENSLQGGELALLLELEGASIPLALTADDAARLLASLINDPMSRVALDRDARKVAACEEQVTAAKALSAATAGSEGELAHMHEQWQAARKVCADKWQGQQEQDFKAFTAQADARHQELARAADAALRELARAVAAQEAEEKRAEAAAERERQRQERAERQRAAERRRRAADNPPAEAWPQGLRCNDGTMSPSCTCGGSHRGCCSHHGGVAGCE